MKLRVFIAEVEDDSIDGVPKHKIMEFHLELRLGSMLANAGKIKKICGVTTPNKLRLQISATSPRETNFVFESL